MKYRRARINPSMAGLLTGHYIQVSHVNGRFWELQGHDAPFEFYTVHDARAVLGITKFNTHRLDDVVPSIMVTGNVGTLLLAPAVNAMAARGLVSVREAASAMSLSRTQVTLLVTTGELDHVRLGRKPVYIYRDSIRAYAQKRIDKWQKAASI